MKKKGKYSRQRKVVASEDYVEEKVPRSFIIHHGDVSSNVKLLISDFKKVMMPNTAQRLTAKRRNVLKDFVSMAAPMKVSHLVMFSQTESGIILRIGRLPQGPTITFVVENYSLLRDVMNIKTRQGIDNKHSLYAPCLMTNLQPSEGEQHLQLCSKMFLNMFPTIAPSTVKMRALKRCCFIHYDEVTSLFDFRHYAIKLRPTAVSRGTKKLMANKVPNLGSYKEVSDFILKTEDNAMSDAEDDPSTHIDISKITKGKPGKRQAIIKLSEMGPRLTLKLVKIEDGLCQGVVLYHKYIIKTAKEKLELKRKHANSKKFGKSKKAKKRKIDEKREES